MPDLASNPVNKRWLNFIWVVWGFQLSLGALALHHPASITTWGQRGQRVISSAASTPPICTRWLENTPEYIMPTLA